MSSLLIFYFFKNRQKFVIFFGNVILVYLDWRNIMFLTILHVVVHIPFHFEPNLDLQKIFPTCKSFVYSFIIIFFCSIAIWNEHGIASKVLRHPVHGWKKRCNLTPPPYSFLEAAFGRIKPDCRKTDMATPKQPQSGSIGNPVWSSRLHVLQGVAMPVFLRPTRRYLGWRNRVSDAEPAVNLLTPICLSMQLTGVGVYWG